MDNSIFSTTQIRNPNDLTYISTAVLISLNILQTTWPITPKTPDSVNKMHQISKPAAAVLEWHTYFVVLVLNGVGKLFKF